MKTWSSGPLRIVLVLLAGATLLHGEVARAQAEEELEESQVRAIGGFEGTAAAGGLRVVYNPEGILPIPAPVDLSAPDALATIASGPSTFARASIADPGDLLANPDALLTQASSDYPEGAIPPYPFRISVSSGSGPPAARLSPAPGLDSSVTADESGSEAIATTPRVAVPAILTVGSARSRATTHTDGATVTVTASSSMSDIDLLGLLTIDSVATDLRATSDGVATTVSGGTVITGASLLGQPVVIDADGIHPQEGARGVQSTLVKALNDVLRTLGLQVTVSSPIEQESPEAGQLISAGLRIDLEVSDRTYPQIGELLGQLPPLPPLVPGAPGLEDVLALARARHLLTIGIGQAEVTLGVRSAGSGPGPTIDVDGPPVDLPAVLPPVPDTGTFDLAPVSSPNVRTVAPGPIQTTVSTPARSLGFAEGIGLLAVLGLLIQPLLADRISRAATLLLAADPAAGCPREGT